jgi:signal transduction histidine kinase
VVLDEDERGHTVQIIDDGRGFDAARSSESAPGHLGLTAMRERAEMAGGWLGLESVPREGTTVTVWVPRWDAQVSHHEALEHDLPRRAASIVDGEQGKSALEHEESMPAEVQRTADC